MKDNKIIDPENLKAYIKGWRAMDNYYTGKLSKNIPFTELEDLIERAAEPVEKHIDEITIGGYPARYLIELAIILNKNDIDPYKLKEYNQAYIDGYRRAHKEFEQALEKSAKNIINGGFER